VTATALSPSAKPSTTGLPLKMRTLYVIGVEFRPSAVL
jgi:hypothetical protein